MFQLVFMKKMYFSLLLFIAIAAAASPPVTPATNLVFNSIEGNKLQFTWTNGSGAKRIVVMKAGSAVTATPVDGIDYTPGTTFGNGDVLAPGEFIVYDGNSSQAAVAGLQPGIVYHIAVFEYNGTGFSTEYLLTALKGSRSTAVAPTTQASALLYTNMAPTSATISWTRGNGNRCLVVLREGSAVNSSPVDLTRYYSNSSFGSGAQVGSGNYTVYEGTGTTVNVSGLKIGVSYHVAVFEFNGFDGPMYLVPALAGSFTTASSPTVPSSTVRTQVSDGKQLQLVWTRGNGTKALMILKKGSPVTAVPADNVDYTENMAFGSGQEIAPGEFVVFDANDYNTFITGLEPSTLYYYRIYEYSVNGGSIRYLTSSFASGTTQTAFPPTTAASNISVSYVRMDYMYMSLTKGNGTGRLVLIKKGSPVDATPADLVKYTSSQTYGAGQQIGNGNYAITPDNIFGLEAGTTYHFAFFEFNGDQQPVYNFTPSRFSATTLSRPTLPPTQMGANAEATSMTVGWQNGNGNRRLVIGKKGSAVTSIPQDSIHYTANGVFGSGQEMAPGEFVLYDNTNNSVAVSGLETATVYHFRVFELNVINGKEVYLTTAFASGSFSTIAPPTVQAKNITATAITQTSITLNWEAGNGTNALLVGRKDSPVTADPVDGIVYTGNTYFGNGEAVGAGNYALLRSRSTSTTITNLQPGTTYHFSLYECNGMYGPAFLRPGITASFTTIAGVSTPTQPATAFTTSAVEGNAMRVGWTNGNGSSRIVVARAGSPVSFSPADATAYVANNQFGNGTNLGNGQYVVYNGNGTYADILNLQKNTVYYFAVFEYNGTGATAKYLATQSLTGTRSTASAPSVNASSISFTAVGATQATINWTNGNGERRLVLIRANETITTMPADLTAYTASTVFGNGTTVGTGTYTVYSNDASSVTVTNLQPGITYHVAILEYNGLSAPVYTTTAAKSSFITVGAPQTQTTNAVVSQVTSNSVQLNWTNGNGQYRLVIGRKNAVVNAVPADNISYNASSVFGNGQLLGTDCYVLYKGTGSSITVTNLEGLSTYHFAVVEYNDFGSGVIRYLTTNPARANVTTTIALPVHLASWTARMSGTIVMLNWSTAMEEHTSHFNIQSGRDGIRFTTVQTITARGNSTTVQQYSTSDAPSGDGVIYYRLEIVDEDGHKTYSDVQQVRITGKSSLSLYPNPATDEVRLTVAATGTHQWIIFNQSGQVQRKGSTSTQQTTIPISTLAAGIYRLQVIHNDQTTTLSFIKQ